MQDHLYTTKIIEGLNLSPVELHIQDISYLMRTLGIQQIADDCINSYQASQVQNLEYRNDLTYQE